VFRIYWGKEKQLDEVADIDQLKALLKWAVVEPSLDAFAIRL